MNNFDKIKNMTLDEMVKLNQYAYSDCLIKIFSGKETECPAMRFREDDAFCDNCFKQWLQQESEGLNKRQILLQEIKAIVKKNITYQDTDSTTRAMTKILGLITKTEEE